MAERKFLDLNGLSTLWNAIKAKIPNKYASSKTEGGAADKAVSIPFGQVDSTSTATAFTATIDGITELRDGVCVYLRNGVITSASGCTLNVNQLGAKPIYASNAAASGVVKVFASTTTMLFVYNSSRIDGGCWDMYYGYDSNSNTIGYQLRTNSLTLPMAQKVYRYRLLFTSADGTKWVGANTSTSTNATASRTPNQTKIDPFGKIVYYGSTTTIDVNESPGATVLWSQYVITLGYSFNNTGAALVLDTFKPVYIKCAPQSDGSAIIDQTVPFTQSLPSTADGKIYIFLGIAVTETTVEVVPEHPIYCYRNGGLQIWTSVQAEIDTLNSSKQNAPLVGQADDSTASDYVSPSDVMTALNAGRDVHVSYTVPLFGSIKFTSWTIAVSANTVVSNVTGRFLVTQVLTLMGGTSNNTWSYDSYVIPEDTSDLTNNAGYVTLSDVDDAGYLASGDNVSELNNDAGYITSTDIPDIPDPSSATPEALGIASSGSSADYSRSDHVHAMPSASDVGAIAAPSSPATGAFLVYDGSVWGAQTLATWQGGNY